MRGLKVRNGALVLRPSGLLLFNSALDVVLGGGLAVAAGVAGGPWLVAVGAYLALIAGDAVLRLRVEVVTDAEAVTVRNRWQTERVPIGAIARVHTDVVRWHFRQPAYVFHGWWPGGRDWEIGVIDTTDGHRIESDALISVPNGDDEVDPTPARMKIDALNRWLAELSAGDVR
jgi:hypothetical protein